MRLRLSALTMTFALTLSIAAVSFAADSVTSCGYTCTNDCELNDDLTCCSNVNLPQCHGGAHGISLANGSDLNFKGHNLVCFCGRKTCNGGTNNNGLCDVNSACPGGGVCSDNTGCTSCGWGVGMTGNGSVVKNLASNGAGIKTGEAGGRWNAGVDCDNKTNSRVTGILVESTSLGVVDCWQVDKNVILGSSPSTGTGIYTTGVTNSDSIHDNYMDNWYDSMWIETDTDMTVDHNLVWTRTGSRLGIFRYNSSGDVTVEDNIFPGQDCSLGMMDSSGPISGNYCSPESGECVATQGVFFELPETPFIMP